MATSALSCSSHDDEGDGGQGQPFSFVVLSDTHVRLPGNPDDTDYDNQKNLDNLTAVLSRIVTDYPDAAFVAVTGDLVGCLYSEDPADYLAGVPNPAETFKSMMDVLPMPWYVALGNHDYQKSYDAQLGEGVSSSDRAAIEAVWKKVLGIDPYYSVVVNGYRLLFLNSNRGPAYQAVCGGSDAEAGCTGSFDEEQIAWLETQLAAAEPCILFFHHPIRTDDPTRLWSILPSFLVQEGDRIYEVIDAHADKIRAIFTGHGHIWAKDMRAGVIPVFETCSVGDQNGSPDNFHLVHVGADGVIEVVKGNESGRYMGEQFVP